MERLTTHWMDGTYDTYDPVDIADNDYSRINYQKLLTKLGEYEDAEEQGLLRRLELKPNDTVYFIFDKKIYEGVAAKVVYVRGLTHDFTRVEIVFEIEDPFYNDGRKMKHGANEIFGEKVFLTKEEAEQALKEGVK